jgi:hypothetical protein
MRVLKMSYYIAIKTNPSILSLQVHPGFFATCIIVPPVIAISNHVAVVVNVALVEAKELIKAPVGGSAVNIAETKMPPGRNDNFALKQSQTQNCTCISSLVILQNDSK